ncbi:hypothetical protein JCM10207_004787 [Rhodosporidiobolus poonsookiae]
MPSPLLPLDLLPLIFQHLEDDLDELDKRETAKRLMLVCKAWKPFAEELAFRQFTLEPNRDEGLVDFLLRQKDLLCHIRELDLAHFLPIFPRKKHVDVKSDHELDDFESIALFLSKVLDKNTLLHCCLAQRDGNSTLIRSLPAFTHLQSLVIDMSSSDLIQAILPAVLDLLPDLTALALLRMTTAPATTEAEATPPLPAPASFLSLATLLPPKLKKATLLGGVFFDLPPMSLFTPQDSVSNLPGPTLTLIGRFSLDDPIAEMFTSIEKPREVEVVRIKEDGAVGEEWKLVAGSFKFD